MEDNYFLIKTEQWVWLIASRARFNAIMSTNIKGNISKDLNMNYYYYFNGVCYMNHIGNLSLNGFKINK